MAKEERWLPVVGYEGSYEVSDRGRVRGLDRTVMRSSGAPQRVQGRLLPGHIESRGGYRQVGLPGNRRKFVHVLVLEAFVSLRPDGLQACHFDGNPLNNALENLRWDTAASNRADAIRHGTHAGLSKTHCPRGHRHFPANCQAYKARRGQRTCLACHRADSYTKKHPELRDSFSAVADDYYRKILEDSGAQSDEN